MAAPPGTLVGSWIGSDAVGTQAGTPGLLALQLVTYLTLSQAWPWEVCPLLDCHSQDCSQARLETRSSTCVARAQVRLPMSAVSQVR